MKKKSLSLAELKYPFPCVLLVFFLIGSKHFLFGDFDNRTEVRFFLFVCRYYFGFFYDGLVLALTQLQLLAALCLTAYVIITMI